jgi:hypothetical protein
MSLPVWQHVWPGRSTPPALGCSNEKDISPVRARRANERCGPDACVVTTEISTVSEVPTALSPVCESGRNENACSATC